jgi:formylglycine-generating enzyme required for sulfatase activity
MSTGGGAATSAEDAAATSAGTAGAPSAVATAAGGGAAATAESGAAATAATAGAAARLAGGFDARPLRTVDGTRLEAELPPGSYLAVIAAPDGAIVRDPFLLARGERLARAIAVPPRAGAPPGFVYIAAGRFLFGTDRDEGIRREFLATQPLHAALTAAFWISRTEVTYGDWLAYLRALPPAERAARGPAAPDVAVEELPDGRFALSIEPAARHRHRAAEGELLVYPGRALRRRVRWERLPVSGVSYHDALAYTAWLDRSGRVRGARLCTVREWERAARGADGRPYPHGDALRPDDANIDATYGRDDDSFGPDEVGAFPASQSPYDVADLAGNVWEWTADARGKPWYKGGSFYQNALTAMSSNGNSPGAAGQRNVRIGLRVCADAARAR